MLACPREGGRDRTRGGGGCSYSVPHHGKADCPHGVGARERGGAWHVEEEKTRSGFPSGRKANQVPAGEDGRCGTRSEGQQGPAGQPCTRKFHGRGAAIGGRRE